MGEGSEVSPMETKVFKSLSIMLLAPVVEASWEETETAISGIYPCATSTRDATKNN